MAEPTPTPPRFEDLPVHVVSEWLGHKNVSMTLEIYAHVLPDMQEDAAATLGWLLHGPRDALKAGC